MTASRVPLAVAFAALAALLCAPALAQTSEPRLSLVLEPAAGEARAGGPAALTALALENRLDRPVTLLLGAQAEGGVRVALETSKIVVPAHGAARVEAALRAPLNATPGERLVTFHAQEAETASRAAPAQAKASYALRVLAPAKPLPPRVSPESLSLAATPGEPLAFSLKVENPTGEPRRYEVRVEAPAGWTLAAERVVLDLPAHGVAPLGLTAYADEGAAPGAGAVVVGAPDALARVPVKLALAAKDAPRPDLAAADAVPAPGGPALLLVVEPAEVELAPEGRAVATLVVTNRARAPASPAFEVRLPPGVRHSFGFVPESIPPGGTASIPLVLEADATVPAGETRPARATLAGAAEGAPFALRFLAAPPAETASVPDAAAGEGLSAGAWVALGAAGVGGAAAGLAFAHRRWPWLFVALYTRLLPGKVLAQPVRERIAALVGERPGITFGELRRALDVGAGTLTHHARVLEGAGVLFSTQDGNQRRFHLVSGGRVEATPPLDERAVRLLRERGPMTAAELARELQVSRQALHYHLKRLMREGRLVGEPRGRELALRVSATTPPS